MYRNRAETKYEQLHQGTQNDHYIGKNLKSTALGLEEINVSPSGSIFADHF